MLEQVKVTGCHVGTKGKMGNQFKSSRVQCVQGSLARVDRGEVDRAVTVGVTGEQYIRSSRDQHAIAIGLNTSGKSVAESEADLSNIIRAHGLLAPH